MAKEYIECEALIDEINITPGSMSICMNVDECKGRIYERERLVRIINEATAADVRPVVLCRDCDNWNEWDSAGRESLGNFRCSCAYWSVEDGPVFYTAPIDFCSYAEPKEVEHG